LSNDIGSLTSPNSRSIFTPCYSLVILLLKLAIHFLPLVPLHVEYRGIQYGADGAAEADGENGLFGSRCRWDFLPGC